jgi:hypothetical protein
MVTLAHSGLSDHPAMPFGAIVAFEDRIRGTDFD